MLRKSIAIIQIDLIMLHKVPITVTIFYLYNFIFLLDVTS